MYFLRCYCTFLILTFFLSCIPHLPVNMQPRNYFNGNILKDRNVDIKQSKTNTDTLYKVISTGKFYKDIRVIEVFYGNNLSLKLQLIDETIKDLNKNINNYFIKRLKSNEHYNYYLTDSLNKKDYKVLDKTDLTKDESRNLLSTLSENKFTDEECKGNLSKIDSCIEVDFFDFDSDGNNELIVLGWNPCFFANHGSYFMILKKLSGSWTILFEEQEVELYDILTTKKNGHYIFYAGGIAGRGGNPEVVKVYYRFNGNKYEEYNTTTEDF